MDNLLIHSVSSSFSLHSAVCRGSEPSTCCSGVTRRSDNVWSLLKCHHMLVLNVLLIVARHMLVHANVQGLGCLPHVLF